MIFWLALFKSSVAADEIHDEHAIIDVCRNRRRTSGCHKGYNARRARGLCLQGARRRNYLPAPLAAKLAERVSGTGLSAREMEVLRRLAAGKSNKEIGAELFISEGTVKSHVKSVFTKLDVVSRTEAVATATRRGLIQL